MSETELRPKPVLPGITGWANNKMCSPGHVSSEMLHPLLVTSKKLLTGNNCDPEKRSQRSKGKFGRYIMRDTGELGWKESCWRQMTCFQDTDSILWSCFNFGQALWPSWASSISSSTIRDDNNITATLAEQKWELYARMSQDDFCKADINVIHIIITIKR